MTAVALFQVRVIVRGRWSLVALAGFALATGVVTLLGLGSFRELGLGAVGPAAVALLNLALLLPTAQAVLLGSLTAATDRETGFFGMLRARGLGPAALVVTAWAAVAASSWLTLLVGFAVAALVLAGNVPLEDMAAFGGLVGVSLAVSAAAAAVGVFIGILVRTRLQAALVAVVAWFVLAVGLDLLVVGLGVFLRAGEPALLGAILVNPLQAARVLALLLLDAGGSVLGPLGLYLLERFGYPGSLGMLAGAILAWVVAPVAVASYFLARRDL